MCFWADPTRLMISRLSASARLHGHGVRDNPGLHGLAMSNASVDERGAADWELLIAATFRHYQPERVRDTN